MKEYELDINEILSKIDIVDVISRYISVTKKGRSYYAICPFHNDTNPSLTISKEKQIFKCFVCGTSGNAISFISKYEKIPFREALYKAADLAGISYDRFEAKKDTSNPYKKCMNDLVEYYDYAIVTSFGKEALEYCESRGLDSDIRKRFHIGYAPTFGEETITHLQKAGNSLKTINELSLSNFINGKYVDKNKNRVIFSLMNEDNLPVAISARRLNDDVDEPKYINSNESSIFHKSCLLYNYYYAKSASKLQNCVYIVEGFMDVIAFYKSGLENVVALMGTSLTKEHINMLRYLKCEIRLCLDEDNAGMMATNEILKNLEEANIPYQIVKNETAHKDADEVFLHGGKDALLKMLNTLVSKQEFIIDYLLLKYDIEKSEDKKKILKEAIPIMNFIKNDIDIEEFANRLSILLKYSKNLILNELTKYKKKNEKKNISIVRNSITTKNDIIEDSYVGNKKIVNLENQLIYQILNSKEALNFFIQNEQYFYNSLYGLISQYLIECLRIYDNVDVNSLISFIEEKCEDTNESSELINSIINIIENEKIPHFNCSDNLLIDIKKKLDFERTYYYQIKQLNDEIENELDSKKKILLISKLNKIIAEKNKKEKTI